MRQLYPPRKKSGYFVYFSIDLLPFANKQTLYDEYGAGSFYRMQGNSKDVSTYTVFVSKLVRLPGIVTGTKLIIGIV